MKKKLVSPVDDDQLYDDVVVVDVSRVVFVSWLVEFRHIGVAVYLACVAN